MAVALAANETVERQLAVELPAVCVASLEECRQAWHEAADGLGADSLLVRSGLVTEVGEGVIIVAFEFPFHANRARALIPALEPRLAERLGAAVRIRVVVDEALGELRASAEQEPGLAADEKAPDEPAAPAVKPDLQPLERNTARVPIYVSGRGGAAKHSMVELTPILNNYQGAVLQVEAPHGMLSVREAKLLAYIHGAFLEAGCPANRRVKFSKRQAVRILGYADIGGWQTRRVKESLNRIQHIRIESVVVFPNGQQDLMSWRLIDLWRMNVSGEDNGYVVLSEPVADLLRQRFVHWYSMDVLDALGLDSVVARLWMALENERMTEGTTWRRAIFSEPDEARSTPTIEEWLRIDDSNKRRVLAKIRAAAEKIEEVDRRYRIRAVPAKKAGRWNLEVRRKNQAPARSPSEVAADYDRRASSAIETDGFASSAFLTGFAGISAHRTASVSE